MDLSHVNLRATGSCAWTALPASITPISCSRRCTKHIETIQVKVIGATAMFVIHILTTAVSPKRINVTLHVPRNIVALWFAENVYRHRIIQKAFSRLIMVVKGDAVDEITITKKND